jgi:hypothetical protein
MKHDHDMHTSPEASVSAHGKHAEPYKKLIWMILISFVAMYILMYAMVDRLQNVVPNINQFYMAGLMTMPMLVIELIVMHKMYPNRKLNIILIVVGLLCGLIFYAGIRQQVGVKDKQFLKSMIPHHAGAILMVEQSELKDEEVKELAQKIIQSQQQEIDFMKAKLQSLKDD